MFTASQIFFAIKQSESGVRIGELCRKMGISEATFYSWKKKYGGLGVSELRELRQLKEENARLKQMVADLSLDRQILQDIVKKSSKTPPETGVEPLDDGSLTHITSPVLSPADHEHFGLKLSPASAM